MNKETSPEASGDTPTSSEESGSTGFPTGFESKPSEQPGGEPSNEFESLAGEGDEDITPTPESPEAQPSGEETPSKDEETKPKEAPSTESEEKPSEEEETKPEDKEKPAEEQPSDEEKPKASEEEEEPAKTPEQLAEQRKAERDKAVDQLTEFYAISEEEGQEIIQEPEKHLPKRLANMHMTIVESVMASLSRTLPQYMQNYSQQQETATTHREKFYTMWPALKEKEEYQRTATSYAMSMRTQRPDAKPEEIMREAGLAAMIHHKLPLPKEMMGSDEPSPSDVPPKPAAAAGGSPSPAPKKEDNEFAIMATEDID